MTIDIKTLYRSDPVKACRLALRRTRNIPAIAHRGEEYRLEACNRLIGGYGTEAIRGEWENGYWCDIRAEFVNVGETYATTIIHDRSGRFIVSTMGDYVESLERRGEEIP